LRASSLLSSSRLLSSGQPDHHSALSRWSRLALLQRQSASPAALAERLGLIGGFSSGAAGSGTTSRGRDHAALLRQKLGRQQQQQRLSEPQA
jgi:hypothetical protein